MDQNELLDMKLNPSDFSGMENFEVVYFPGTGLFKILGGDLVLFGP